MVILLVSYMYTYNKSILTKKYFIISLLGFWLFLGYIIEILLFGIFQCCWEVSSIRIYSHYHHLFKKKKISRYIRGMKDFTIIIC